MSSELDHPPVKKASSEVANQVRGVGAIAGLGSGSYNKVITVKSHDKYTF